MAICSNSALPNAGKDCKLESKRIRRMLFVATNKEDGTPNFISKADAVLIDNWQTLFDKYNFADDVLEKVVAGPLVYDALSSVENQNIFDQDTYQRTIYKGDTDVNFNLNDVDPDMIAQLQDLEDKQISVFLVDDDGKVYGVDKGVNVYPYQLKNLDFANWSFPGDSVSQSGGVLRFANPRDLNKTYQFEVLDSDGDFVDMNDQTNVDVWSLTTSTLTSTNPSTGGCDFTVTTDRYGTNVTGIAFGDITFVDQSDGTEKTLAAAGSLTENETTGVYSVSELALLDPASTYKIEVALSKFDIVHSNTVIVP